MSPSGVLDTVHKVNQVYDDHDGHDHDLENNFGGDLGDSRRHLVGRNRRHAPSSAAYNPVADEEEEEEEEVELYNAGSSLIATTATSSPKTTTSAKRTDMAESKV